MSQTRDQIEAHRDQARSELQSNLRELEKRAESAMDWKRHFEESPGTLLAVAFGGGIALSLLVGCGRAVPGRSAGLPAPRSDRSPGNTELWERVKGALIGVVAARVTEYAGQLIPRSNPSSRPRPESSAPEVAGLRT